MRGQQECSWATEGGLFPCEDRITREEAISGCMLQESIEKRTAATKAFFAITKP
jgi:hypothetical protein